MLALPRLPWPCLPPSHSLSFGAFAACHTIDIILHRHRRRRQAPERLLRLECSLFSDVWSLGLGKMSVPQSLPSASPCTHPPRAISSRAIVKYKIIKSSRTDVLDRPVTLELLTGRHVLASPPPPPPPQANADDLEEGGNWRAEGAASATPTPSTPNNMARREEEPTLRSLAAKASNALESSLLDQTGDGAEQAAARMMEAEQDGIAQRLVALNLPMGLIKASGYTATGASRPPALPPPCNSATLFLTDCLQKMPHLRRHCTVLLESKFISDCRDLAPSVALDWIRDPSIELVAPDRSEGSHPDEVPYCRMASLVRLFGSLAVTVLVPVAIAALGSGRHAA